MVDSLPHSHANQQLVKPRVLPQWCKVREVGHVGKAYLTLGQRVIEITESSVEIAQLGMPARPVGGKLPGDRSRELRSKNLASPTS